MGHVHLGTLSRSRLWQDVVLLLGDRAAVEDVVSASATAAENSLLNASNDSVFVESVRLLLNIPLAARRDDFAGALRQLDLDVGNSPSLIEIVSAANRRLEAVARGVPTRSDFSNMSMRALSRAISDCVGHDLPGLFGPSAEDVQSSFRKFSRDSGMSAICRSYFGALVGTSLSYWLDRTLNNNIGEGQRFARVTDRAAFDHSMQIYVGETSRIIKEFAAGWVGKTSYRTGTIATSDARDFAHVSLKKMVDELRSRRDPDA